MCTHGQVSTGQISAGSTAIEATKEILGRSALDPERAIEAVVLCRKELDPRSQCVHIQVQCWKGKGHSEMTSSSLAHEKFDYYR